MQDTKILSTVDMTTTTHVRTIALEGAAHIDYTLSRKYQPHTISLRWEDGDKPEIVKVSGSIIKIDGTVGGQRGTKMFSLIEGDENLAPQWVLDLIA